MFDMTVRWRQPLDERVTCAPVKMRDLTILRQSHQLKAYDDRGRQVWARDISSTPVEGELAANSDVIITTMTIEMTDDDGNLLCAQTRFDAYDEGAELLESFTFDGTMRNGGLVVHETSMHAWMNDGGIALRRRRLDQRDDLMEVFVPFAQPWDRNVSKRGVVLVGFTGRREGACLWDPRTEVIKTLIDDVDVWSHGVTDDIAVFAIGPDEVHTTLVAIDLRTREEIWRREDTTRGIAVTPQGVLAYLGGQDRIAVLLDIDTGDILWMATVPHRGFEWEIVGDLAMSRGRDTAAYDIHTGDYLGTAPVRGLVEFEDYFVAVQNDELVAYEMPTASNDAQPYVIVPRAVRTPRIPTPVLGVPARRLAPAMRRA